MYVFALTLYYISLEVGLSFLNRPPPSHSLHESIKPFYVTPGHISTDDWRIKPDKIDNIISSK